MKEFDYEDFVSTGFYYEDYDDIFYRKPHLVKGFEELAKLLRLPTKKDKAELAEDVNGALLNMLDDGIEEGTLAGLKIVRRATLFRRQFKVCV